MSQPEQSRLGQRLIAVPLGCGVLYLATTVFGSLIADLYGGPPSAAKEEDTQAHVGWCYMHLSDLAQELVRGLVIDLEGTVRTAPAENTAWYRAHERISGRCRNTGHEDLDAAHDALNDLRQRVSAARDDLAHARAAFALKLNRTVRTLR